MSVVEVVAHYLTAEDLGLAIRDALCELQVGAYGPDRERIAASAEQVCSVDFNDPRCLIVEVPSGAIFSIKIERIKTATRAKVEKELFVQPVQPEYGPRNV